jgi:RNA polymerase sigma-70 factor (ECF subfamily)
VAIDPGDAVSAAVREDYARILATLVRVTGDVTAAEDAVGDALVRALETWPRDGIPDNPRAWLIVVARRSAVDRARREAVRRPKEVEAVALADPDPSPPADSVVRDDVLRLVFTCCHPSLSQDAQVALSLRTLCGLTTAETARALLVPEATMAKRLTRAKQKIRQARIPYRVPPDPELPARLAGVLGTVYLVFNEGYSASSGSPAVRLDLVDEALRLGRLLRELMPDEPSVTGLLALMTLQDSRRATRTDGHGVALRLADQDRRAWDREAIRRGVELVGEGLRRTPERPDPYVVQAAIAACHALAPTYADTDWSAIVSWYDVLLAVSDTPAARLGRAVALSELHGPAVALPEVDAIEGLESYAWWHASRAELLHRLDRRDEAELARQRAQALGLNDATLRSLERSLDAPPL